LALPAVRNFPPTFTTGAAAAAGLPGISLLRLRDAGGVIELSRGVFRGADAPAPTYADLLALSVRAPAGIICAVSAAAFHGLTDVVVGNLRFGLTGIIWALTVTEGAVLPVGLVMWLASRRAIDRGLAEGSLERAAEVLEPAEA